MDSFDYVLAAKELRKFTPIKIDLRNKISPGKKSSIRRAYNLLQDNTNNLFVKPKKIRAESIRDFRSRRANLEIGDSESIDDFKKRKKKLKKNKAESKTAFKRRLSKLKKSYGYAGKSLDGIFVKLPKNAVVTVNIDNELIIKNPKINFYKETIVPISKSVMLSESMSSLVSDIISKFLLKNTNTHTIQSQYLGNRSTSSFAPDSVDLLIEELVYQAEFYPGFFDFFIGIIFIEG